MPAQQVGHRPELDVGQVAAGTVAAGQRELEVELAQPVAQRDVGQA